MATGGHSRAASGTESSTVRLFITSYTDDFFSERDILKKEILPELRHWCSSKQLTLTEKFIKWGSKHPEKRDTVSQESIQTSIENCYYNNVMPIFINFSSEGLGWVPMWGEYTDELIEDYIEAYGLLVEDLEVLYGAYREDNHNSLFLLRHDSVLEQVPPSDRKHFVQKSPASEKIQSMGDKVVQKFPPGRIINYHCEYRGLDSKKRPHLQFETNFRQTILDFCKQRILYDFCGQQPQSFNNLDNIIRRQHELFMECKSATVLGRMDILQKIEDHVFREDKDVPLILLGDPGCGKSSVLCKAAHGMCNQLKSGVLGSGDGKDWHIFFHFVGAVPGSTALEPMLKRLLREMEVTNDSNMPRDVNATAQLCCSLLSNPNTRPVIIFVDALNQFSEDQAAKVLSWLPRKLAPQVRCIFSMINDTQQHQTLLMRETKPIEIKLSPLDMDSRKGIVCEMMKKYNRTLSPSQLDCLLSHVSSENPLWLTVACEELCLFHSQEEVEMKIRCLPEGLLNLLEELLKRFEEDEGGVLIVATLCLLEASAAGLLESELRQILEDEEKLMPPSPFDEKEEKETSEKESSKHGGMLSESKWRRVFRILQPYLRPYGDSREGRLDFYHRALSKAVRRRYFPNKENELEEDKPNAFNWWHKKLADFFEHVENVDRLVEEYPYQLVCLEDRYRLGRCLCDWRVFDQLYNEEYSSQLLAYWRKVGTAADMISQCEEALARFEKEDSVNEEAVSIRYEKVCRVVIQAGKYHEALELLKTAMKIEEKELGARPHRMVELYALMAEIYDEKLKLNDFVSPSQLPDLRKTIHYGKKSIALRKTLPGTYHRFKLAMSLMKLAFNMESWEACGGGPELTGADALTEGNKYIDKALKIFQELNDQGHYAEALMTKGVLAPRGCMEQLKLYNEAMDLCMQMYGEYHILTSRLYINIGIVYEDTSNYKKAYEYFKKWARVSEEILGPEHPKTLRAKGVLRETRYRTIARDLGEYQDDVDEENQEQEDEDDDEEIENPDLEHYYDDQIGHNNNQQLALDNSMIQEANVIEVAPDVDEDNGEVLMNGFFEQDEYEHESDHENSDNENFYDDNFEDYDEQYILHGDNGPVIEDFNVNIEEDDDDDEIVQLSSRNLAEPEETLESLENLEISQSDNRYASDSHEDDDEENIPPSMTNSRYSLRH